MSIIGSVLKAHQHKDGVMISLDPHFPVASSLVIPGGERAKNIHVTLFYFGKIDDLNYRQSQDLREAVKIWASTTPPIKGTVSGYGVFKEGEVPVTYYSVDSPSIDRHRPALRDFVEGRGIEPKTDHGYFPHITASYFETEEEGLLNNNTGLLLYFPEVSLHLGDRVERFRFKASPTASI